MNNINKLVKLFDIEVKSILYKFCRNLTISMNDFVGLVELCEIGKLPYKHIVKFTLYVPEHLHPTHEDFEIFNNKIKTGNINETKFIKKLIASDGERRNLVKHLFYSEVFSKWHYFYFDQKDFKKEDNRWVLGNHIHFFNYLWPNYNVNILIEEFDNKKINYNDSIHIKTEGWH